MLGTSSIITNEVFVTCIQPLAPGDEVYALSFVVPLNAKASKTAAAKVVRDDFGTSPHASWRLTACPRPTGAPKHVSPGWS